MGKEGRNGGESKREERGERFVGRATYIFTKGENESMIFVTRPGFYRRGDHPGVIYKKKSIPKDHL